MRSGRRPAHSLGCPAGARPPAHAPPGPSARASTAAAGPSRAKLDRSQPSKRGPLDEVIDARPEENRAVRRGRQDVVRAADIVAHHLGRQRPEEDRAGVADRRRQRLGGGHRRAPGARAPAHRPAPAPRRARRPGCTAPCSRQLARAIAAAASAASCRSTAASTARGEGSVVGDQDRLRALGHARPGTAGRPRSSPGSFPASATITTSEGPAIMSMPTRPNTCRLASAT